MEHTQHTPKAPKGRESGRVSVLTNDGAPPMQGLPHDLHSPLCAGLVAPVAPLQATAPDPSNLFRRGQRPKRRQLALPLARQTRAPEFVMTAGRARTGRILEALLQ